MRVGYTTDCRFFAGRPDVVSKVKWIPCAKGAPALGIPSVICNRMMDDEPYQFDDLGEVWRAKRPPNNAKAIPGALGAHVCGTPQQFREGERRDETLPPVIYTTSGLPRCCNPAIVGAGGIGIGGVSVPSMVLPSPPPGSTCLTAVTLTPGVPYSFVTDGRDPVPYWIRVSAPTVGAYKLFGTMIAASSGSLPFFGVCSFLFPLVWNTSGPSCRSTFIGAAPATIHVPFTIPGSGSLVTVTLGSGAC